MSSFLLKIRFSSFDKSNCSFFKIIRSKTVPKLLYFGFKTVYSIFVIRINGFNCQEPNGAFYCFPNIKATNKSSTIIQNELLDNLGVATVAGTSFGEYGEGFIRLSCANSNEAIQEAIERIKTVY